MFSICRQPSKDPGSFHYTALPSSRILESPAFRKREREGVGGRGGCGSGLNMAYVAPARILLARIQTQGNGFKEQQATRVNE